MNRRQLLKGSRIGSAFAKGRLPTAVVDPLAEPFNRSLPLEARKGLRDGREWQVTEVVNAPEARTRGQFAGLVVTSRSRK